MANMFNNYKIGFTLAEVLITLGIIGIVAALTLPSLIHKNKTKELEIRFRQTYSIISQAVARMSAENPDIVGTYCTNRSDSSSDKFARAFSKYFQTVKFFPYHTSRLSKIGYNYDYFLTSAKNNFNTDAWNNGAFILKNGAIVFSSGCWWAGNGIIPVDFVVDTNGVKGPNRFGYDVFYFQIIPGNIMLPSNSSYNSAYPLSQDKLCCNFVNESCPVPQDNGSACSWFALKNKFPADETKTYWDNLP